MRPRREGSALMAKPPSLFAVREKKALSRGTEPFF